MNQVESTLHAITTSIAALENSKNPNQTLLESLRKERDSILNDLNINNNNMRRKICMKK